MTQRSTDDLKQEFTLDSDMVGAEAAMLRASERARRRARENGSSIAVLQDNKMVWLNPDDEAFQ